MKIIVEFEIANEELFKKSLMEWDLTTPNTCVGYRIDDGVSKREALRKFADEMELKLRKNDHKSDWREKPIQALFKLLLIELEEFKALYDYFPTAEARRELVDVANFCMIVHDRMGDLVQRVPAKLQEESENDRRAKYRNSLCQSLPAGTADGVDNTEVVGGLDSQQRYSSQS